MNTIPRKRILTVLFAVLAILMPFSVIAQSDGGGKKKKKKAQTEQVQNATRRKAEAERKRKAEEQRLREAEAQREKEAEEKRQRELEEQRKREAEAKRKTSTGIIRGHEWVDLGLPSGLKWATCNVGASSPSDYGSYFAWGETTTKSSYTGDNSKTYGQNFGYISRNPSCDPARANWGGTWRLPTKAECQELADKCKWTWTTHGGRNGYKVTGPNGNSIFLPAAGWRNGMSFSYMSAGGSYWSSTPYEQGTVDAYYLNFNSRLHHVDWYYRYYGRSVRPVAE